MDIALAAPPDDSLGRTVPEMDSAPVLLDDDDPAVPTPDGESEAVVQDSDGEEGSWLSAETGEDDVTDHDDTPSHDDFYEEPDDSGHGEFL